MTRAFIHSLCLMVTMGAAAIAAPIKPIDPLQLRLENVESSLRRLEQRLNNQDTSLETMHLTLEQEMKDKKGNTDVDTLKMTSGSLVDDVKKLRDALQKTNESLKKWSEEVDRLDKTVAKQAQDIANLKDAISSLVDAVHTGTGNSDTSVAYHKVGPGETLGVIAQQHHTSIKAIKAINDMKNDTIYVGQKLRLPPARQ